MRLFIYRSEDPYKWEGSMVFSLQGTFTGIGVLCYGKLAL